MFNYLPLQWLFLFYFYSFLGWCFESAYVTVMEKHPVNRGFMRGPFLPLYGSGGIMMLVVSRPFYDNVFLVYIAGCIGATVLEYVVGVLMETLFKVRYWDYSHKKFNFKGYVCLESTLVWGVCTIVFSHYLQIPVEKVICSIPYNFLTIFTVVLTVGVSCDFMLAFKTAIELRDILLYMEKAKYEMARMQKRLDVIIAFKGEEVKEGIGSKVEGISNGISNTVEGISNGIGNTVEGISNGIGNTVEGISNGIGSRMDVLSSSLEKSFSSIKEKIRLNPSAYVGSVKEEVIELYTKYCVLMDRVTPPPVKSFFEWYRTRTIMGNPSMYSERFKTSLEEIKERASKIRNGRG
ncbi:putative ABC transporter permease [Butyrivibrio sp. YAB3001]|uniref:putative ABC transporter permease n=1 Tax=Butyrivibrio sp. YAB3001 TaxID=1520812 RepID=UPI0008F64041|nr:putative ABC transporter permease [Butyrivibrio sp. YAB3001]SFB75225.1 Uncharacterized membrane protein [Butyrivibrio sp. YAB3001]